MLKTVSALAALATIALSAPAFARDKAVSYADLNLASTAGRAALDNRLDRAAKTVCAVGEHSTLSGYAASKACYTASIAVARQAAETAIARHAGATVQVASR